MAAHEYLEIDCDTRADGTSAYDAAVAGGYTGTEEDFNALMAEIGAMIVAEEVEW